MFRWLLEFFKRREAYRRKEWGRVPPPSGQQSEVGGNTGENGIKRFFVFGR